MSEKRNITYNLTFAIDSGVSTPAKLLLQSADLTHGKWLTAAPSEIVAKVGGSTTVSFKASGAKGSATGAAGSVVYKGTDADETEFNLTFSIPYSKANSGNLTGGSEYYTTQGGSIPVSDHSATVNVTITQNKPTI